MGFEACRFARDVLGLTLIPWQEWWLVHALELDENGDFRFRTVVTLVSRQNGKTELLKILSLFLMYSGKVRLILGAAQSLDIATESWRGACEYAESDPDLAEEIAEIRHTNGQNYLLLKNKARYRITAASRSAGRGLSVDLLILDELREHRDWAAWSALSKTTTARPNALIVCLSNAGDDQSAVLNQLRETALSGRDPRMAIFEWSAPDGCELDDPEAWAQANPGLGYTISYDALCSFYAQDPPATFRTENLCQKVDQLAGAIDLGAWKAGEDATGTLDGVRDRVMLGIDVAPDGEHVALIAGAEVGEGRYRIEPVMAWPSVDKARTDLPDLLARINPAAIAWFPNGPAAALGAELKGGTFASRLGDVPPIEVKGAEIAEACQAFADLVLARKILHPGDPMLNAHIAGAQKYHVGDGWRFVRRGAGHVSAAYAAAGVVHALRTVPEAKPAPWFGVV